MKSFHISEINIAEHREPLSLAQVDGEPEGAGDSEAGLEGPNLPLEEVEELKVVEELEEVEEHLDEVHDAMAEVGDDLDGLHLGEELYLGGVHPGRLGLCNGTTVLDWQ